MDLSFALLENRDFARAESVCRELVIQRRAQHPIDKIRLALTLANLGEALVEQGQEADAQDVLREAMEVFEARPADQHHVANILSLLASVSIKEEDYSGAEAMLRKALPWQQSATIPARFRYRLLCTMRRFIKLYETWGRSELAAIWREELGRRSAGDGCGSFRDPSRDDRSAINDQRDPLAPLEFARSRYVGQMKTNLGQTGQQRATVC